MKLSHLIEWHSVLRCVLCACPRFHHTTSAACCCSKTRSGEKYIDPFKLGWRDLKDLYEDIRKVREL